MTLIYEKTKLILTDDANKEIPTQCLWHHPVAKFLTNASGANWCLNSQQMHVVESLLL